MARLNIILASTRTGRVGPQIAEWFTEQARHHGGFEVQLVDLAQVNLPFLDEPHHPSERRYLHQHTKDWSATIDAADAFVFVMPEYNTGFTAPLKNAIDFLDQEWHDKPVAFVSYGMSSAGLRAAQMIKPVVSAVKMIPVAPNVAVPLRQHLDQNGELHPTDQMNHAAVAVLDELQRLTTTLTTLRAVSTVTAA